MLGYYTSLLKTYSKKVSIYILLAVFLIIFILLTISIYYADESYTKEVIYIIATSGITFIFMVVFWFIFYNNIYRTLMGSNLELLSFTTGLSRTKIFFAKFFVFLTLSSILSIYMSVILLIPTVAVYKDNLVKILHLVLGTILIGTFGSLAFYFFTFFVDTLSKNAKRKRSLAWAPLTTILLIFGVSHVTTFVVNLTAANPSLIGKGYGDYKNNKIYNKNLENIIDVSTSNIANYIDYRNSSEEHPRDVDYYNNKTSMVKGIGVFTNYLNFKNVVEKAQGIEFNGEYGSGLTGSAIYHHQKGVNQALFEKLAFINVKMAGKTEKMYFHHMPWSYNEIDSYVDTSINMKERIKAYETEINVLIEKLKNSGEFQKEQPIFETIKDFLEPLMNEAFIKSPFAIKTNSDEQSIIIGNETTEQKRIFPGYPANPNWLIGYIYLKAKPEGKTLIFNQIDQKNFSKDLKQQFVDADGKIYYPPIRENDTDEANEKYEKELAEFNDRFLKAKYANSFLTNYTNPNEVLFSRTKTSDYEYPWISWILIAIIILGMGYWSLERYNRKDVA